MCWFATTYWSTCLLSLLSHNIYLWLLLFNFLNCCYRYKWFIAEKMLCYSFVLFLYQIIQILICQMFAWQEPINICVGLLLRCLDMKPPLYGYCVHVEVLVSLYQVVTGRFYGVVHCVYITGVCAKCSWMLFVLLLKPGLWVV